MNHSSLQLPNSSISTQESAPQMVAQRAQEALIEESLVEVTFETDRQCRVGTGRWYGAFDGHDLGNTNHLDVDHMVPLRNAHLSGGWAWSSDRKDDYANHLGYDDHLIAVASRANRSKGARGA